MRLRMPWPSTVFFQTSSILIGFLSAAMIGQSSILMTPAVLAELATTKWGYNPDVVQSLAGQVAHGRVGLTLLVVSITLAFPTLRPENPRKPVGQGVLWGLAASAVVALIAFWLASILEANLAHDATAILSNRQRG